MYDNKQVVKELKESISYRSKHLQIIEKFKYAIINYFLEKYDARVRVLTGVTWFAVELNTHYYYGGNEIVTCNFEWTSKVIYEFCQEFECEFEHTSCDGERYIFTFKDVDVSNAFIIG